VTLFLLLIIPSLTQRIQIPSCVGFIAAGVLIGPHGLDVVLQHADVASFFAELGKLLLMFFVGLEIDIQQFTANWLRSLALGMLTFALSGSCAAFQRSARIANIYLRTKRMPPTC
jgi:Kef-type K+ transport system membrane component KefB